MSIITVIIPDINIYFIGETANNRLKVAIVGITISERLNVLSTAPIPTANPPKHPTIKRVALIKPKRLNSMFLPNIFSELTAVLFSIM